jgi:hypothetical protein
LFDRFEETVLFASTVKYPLLKLDGVAVSNADMSIMPIETVVIGSTAPGDKEAVPFRLRNPVAFTVEVATIGPYTLSVPDVVPPSDLPIVIAALPDVLEFDTVKSTLLIGPLLFEKERPPYASLTRKWPFTSSSYFPPAMGL